MKIVRRSWRFPGKPRRARHRSRRMASIVRVASLAAPVRARAVQAVQRRTIATSRVVRSGDDHHVHRVRPATKLRATTILRSCSRRIVAVLADVRAGELQPVGRPAPRARFHAGRRPRGRHIRVQAPDEALPWKLRSAVAPLARGHLCNRNMHATAITRIIHPAPQRAHGHGPTRRAALPCP